jgi:hypothetical protein
MEKMATETQSDETPLWIIEVVGQAQVLPSDFACPLAESSHVNVVFKFPRHKQALTA